MHYTVVNGSASADWLQRGSRQHQPHALTLLSARPDGRQLDLLSLVVVASLEVANDLNACLRCVIPQAKLVNNGRQLARIRPGVTLPACRTDGRNSAGVSVSVASSSTSSTTLGLACAWHSMYRAFNATLFRVLCVGEDWNAGSAMQSERLHMTLTVALPRFDRLPRFEASLPFTTEALSRFPQSGIAGCVDFAYHHGDRRRDFNEWATAQRLVGVDRIYVSDQLRYREQVRDQIRRRFAFATHDLPHRYVSTPRGRDEPPPPTTYHMFELTTSAQSFLCLHEHWYEDWIYMSYSTDEYLVFPTEPPPTRRTPLVAKAIASYFDAHRAPTTNRVVGWSNRRNHSFCVSELCLIRPFYGPSQLLEGESPNWTLPADATRTRLRYGSRSQLAIERFTQRFRGLPSKTGLRKCLVHPDWRLGAEVRVHGFKMWPCPAAGIPGCIHGWAGLRSMCLQICGKWGNDSAPVRDGVCRGQANHGALMRTAEVAHFRVPSPECRQDGSDAVTWLSGLASLVRQATAV